MNTYSEFQNAVSSEKLTLAVLNASKRLMGWTLHSGSVYKLTNFSFPALQSIEDSGTAYTAAASLGAISASKYFYDRSASTLYIQTTGSDNPNGRFIAATVRFFFANAPITLPHDLSTGYDVYFDPMISSTSSFGVEIDVINQAGEAVEGSGSLTLFNDQSFWQSHFDKLVFENKDCYIYSYHRDLPLSEKKLLFQGKIEKKSYSTDKIQFALKDLLSELKNIIPLANMEDVGGARIPDNLNLAKQRTIYGRVYGHRPTNIDQVLTGYPGTGTISVTNGSVNVTGSGTTFLTQLKPDDQLVIADERYTIADVTSDTAATLSEAYPGGSDSGLALSIVPDRPKRFMNRVWKIAGHALREPIQTTEATSTVEKLHVADTTDMYAGDKLYLGNLGSGELVTVDTIQSEKIVKLTQTLAGAPSVGTALRKPAVQNVRINDVELLYYRDYTLDASTATLTLRPTAEANASPIRQLANNITFTSGSRTVTGAGFNGTILPGYMVGCVGQADFFEVLAVDSDTSLRITSNATYTSSSTKGLYKALIFDPEKDVLTCEVLGKTANGTTSGELLDTAPAIVESMLGDLGLSSIVDTASFTEAKGIAYQQIGIVIPEKYTETKTPTFKDAINKINKSVFGSLIQSDAFKLSYLVLRPKKSISALRFGESDILRISAKSSAEKVIKTAIVTYAPREYDYTTLTNSVQTHQQTSDNATYLIQTDRERVFTSYLSRSEDALIYANRWSFLLETSAGSLDIETKLQGATLEVGDIIDVEHRKLFERIGDGQNRRLVLVEKVKKNGESVSLEVVDLSNTFNRVAAITDATNDWVNATSDEKLYGGFITDQYGLINNDPDSFGTNLIW